MKTYEAIEHKTRYEIEVLLSHMRRLQWRTPRCESGKDAFEKGERPASGANLAAEELAGLGTRLVSWFNQPNGCS